ncbi:TetR/AcrR family transcriptional regulator [Nonomuraea sp. NPDC002799]
MTSDDGPEHGVGALRKDAERNRERVLAAARQAYAEDGLEVSMAEVARRAGVGIATVFRRFPTREDLIDAVFADRMDAYLGAITTAAADPDPWRAFTGYIEAVCAMQAADRGFAAVLTMTFPTAKALEDKRGRAYEGFIELIDRAKAAGRLRPDFAAEDLVILLMANAGVVSATGQAAPGTWRRLVGYMIAAFAAPGAPPEPLPPPPTPTGLYRAMIQLGRTCRPGPA